MLLNKQTRLFNTQDRRGTSIYRLLKSSDVVVERLKAEPLSEVYWSRSQFPTNKTDNHIE